MIVEQPIFIYAFIAYFITRLTILQTDFVWYYLGSFEIPKNLKTQKQPHHRQIRLYIIQCCHLWNAARWSQQSTKKKQQKVDTLLQNCIHSLSNNFDNSDNRSRNIKHIDIGYQSFLCIYLYTRAACYVHHLLALLVLFFFITF